MTILAQATLSTDTKISDLNEYGSRVILFQLQARLVRGDRLLPGQLNGSGSRALKSKLGRGEGEHQHIVRLEVKVGCPSLVKILQTCADLKEVRGEGE